MNHRAVITFAVIYCVGELVFAPCPRGWQWVDAKHAQLVFIGGVTKCMWWQESFAWLGRALWDTLLLAVLYFIVRGVWDVMHERR